MSYLIHCYNKGCGNKFDPAENNDDSCQFHPGVPVFHDAMKGWSCCKKRSTDFTEFLNFPGCSKGKHTNEKPPEPEKQKVETIKDEVIEVKAREPVKPRDPADRPSSDEPMIPLRVNVVSSLKLALAKHMQNLNIETTSTEDPSTSQVKVGTSCKNNACKACYQGEEGDSENCKYHPGVPVFHEGLKYWSCCQRKTTEFDVFLDQEGCENGSHLWVKPNVSGEKKSCRFDWHQTTSFMTISVYSKVAIPEKCTIKANRVCCDISIVFEGGNSLFENKVILREVINPEQSNVKMMGTKVEILLKKAECFSWPTLELPPQNEESKEVGDS